MEEKPHKPHVLIVPYPAQGHINPMLQFAKRLLPKGIKSTLATTVSTFKSMQINPANSIAIETFSDGFDEGGYSQAESLDAYVESLKRVGSETLSKLIKKLDENGQPVTAAVYDGFMPWALDVAKEFGLLGVVFFTQSCAVNNIYYHVYKGLLPLPLTETTVSIPGLPVLQASETPSFINDFGSYPGFFHTVVNQFSNIDEADWVLFNTFYKLEETVVDWLAKQWKLGTIGPTLPSVYLDKRLEDDKDYEITLFKPKTDACMTWLNDKPKNSVVYVSFGSMAEAEEQQVEELAWGLKSSNCFFLWVVRETEDRKLPKKFKEETSEKGLVVSWCPQLEVLTHESICCFVTHCGLNSVLEALSLGIPMVAMPQWTDQPTNAKFVKDVWRTGIRAWSDKRGIVRREVVEICIKEVMEGEKGKEMKKNAKIWKNLAREAVDEGGSSDKAIDEFIGKILLCP
ncbi:hypothetical protein Pint_07919 [Pistacia integerrima]|uniref:Uncharacterized protein n=1 Tax=Pistacia integerrima TaxID=434235 RepID=A0ACC0XUS6_9ROSI|nr:hypothetical protein Pint_07919 [Pistacia integerrima]